MIEAVFALADGGKFVKMHGDEIMKRAIHLLTLFLVAGLTVQANGLDESASLALLVRTLESTNDAAIQTSLMRGMVSGFEGRRKVAEPAGWGELSAKLANSEIEEVRNLSLRLGQIFGDERATRVALRTLRDPDAEVARRRAALTSLVTQQNPQLGDELEALLDHAALRQDAIRAYRSIEDARAPEILLARYGDLDFQGRRAVVETLATRKTYAEKLLAAIESGTVPKEDVPAYIARSMGGLLGERFTRVYGDVKELTKDKAQLIAKYEQLLTPGALARADANKGRGVFERACASCHVIYGRGGMIGPDLTGSNRANIDYILLNMLDPSADIPDAYKLITIETKNGQLLAGTLAEENSQRVVLNTVGQRSVVAKSDIKTRAIAPVSMMPEGLLTTLKDQEVLDLVKFLQTQEQVP